MIPRKRDDDEEYPAHGHETKDSQDAARSAENPGTFGNEPEGAEDQDDEDDG